MRNHQIPPHGIVHPPGITSCSKPRIQNPGLHLQNPPKRVDLTSLRRCLGYIACLCLLTSMALAEGLKIDRKVFLPTPEMNLLTGDGKQGILLSTEEYKKLIQESSPSEQKPESELPLQAAYE